MSGRRVHHAPRGKFTRTPLRHDRRIVRHWSPDEDALILKMVSAYGRSWFDIATHLPQRTDNAVRNRFMRITQGVLKLAKRPESCYVCSRCGQLKRGHTCSARANVGVEAPLAESAIDLVWHEVEALLSGF